MKIALFSDIHANLPALMAFFEDVEGRNVDTMYCLGDLVGYNVWVNEVINEIRSRHIQTIAGNYDFGIGRNSDDCGCAYKTDQEKANGAISISFTNEIVGGHEREYLRTLPAHIRVEFQMNHDKFNLLMVHGSPRRINEYLFEDREEKSLLRIMQEANTEIMCFGHTHKPYHRMIQSGNKVLHAINIGSVGKPKDNNPDGGYVIITLNELSHIETANSIQVEFVRFKYDVKKAARAVEESRLPNEYADMLRRGY
jgi:predicted phosphodiesterase